MAHPTVILNIVGLTQSLIGDHSPHLRDFVVNNHLRTLAPVLPAVTCTVQSSMLTGEMPRVHGIVGNGWYNREMAEVQFWKQSNHLVQSPKVWEIAKKHEPNITCANMFWWYNMYSTADWSVTPGPMYKADGRKIPDCYSKPSELRPMLQSRLGQFPLFNFWGPASSIQSSSWIAEASIIVDRRHSPTLMLIYLPHLDYSLQKLGPHHPDIIHEVQLIDEVFGRLLEYYEKHNARVIVVSEYSIEEVSTPVDINRYLRESNFISVREEQSLELLDAGASDAFAVADHQLAHVYIPNQSRVNECEQLCRNIPGVDHVLNRETQAEHGIDHPRAGDLVLIADSGCWFTYYYWLDDSRAPDFARTVDIHRKPGYDPVELFIDPEITLPRFTIASKLLRKKLGFRTLLDVIPLDGSLVQGSHGRTTMPPSNQPVLITPKDMKTNDDEQIPCTAVRDIILDSLFT